MAYAYNQISQLFGDSNQQPNQDIFNTNPLPTQAAPAQASPGAQNPTLTSLAGGAITPNPSSSSQAASQGNSTGVSDSSGGAAGAALAANAGKQPAEAAYGGVANQIQSASDANQAEADKYVANAKPNYQYNLGNDVLDSAIAGDTGAKSKVGNLFGQTLAAPAPTFVPKNSTGNVEDANLLANSEGQQQLYQRGQDNTTYTPGMAAFSSAVNQANPQFQNLMGMLGSKYQAEKNAELALPASAQKQVQDYGQSQLGAAQLGARDYLGSHATGILADEQAAADAYNKGLPSAPTSAQMAGDLQGELGSSYLQTLQTDPRLASYLKQLPSMDPTQFYGMPSQASSAQFVSPEAASRYNNIEGMLGQSGAQMPSLAAPSSQPVLDKAALDAALLKSAQGLQSADDTSAQAQIDSLNNAAFGRAQGQSEVNRTEDLKAAGAQDSAEAFKAAPSLTQQLLARGVTPEQLNAAVDPSQFESMGNTGLIPGDMYTPEEAQKINSLLGNMGKPQTAQASKGAQNHTFNRPGYLSAVQNYINKLPGFPNETQAEPGTGIGQQTANTAIDALSRVGMPIDSLQYLPPPISLDPTRGFIGEGANNIKNTLLPDADPRNSFIASQLGAGANNVRSQVEEGKKKIQDLFKR